MSVRSTGVNKANLGSTLAIFAASISITISSPARAADTTFTKCVRPLLGTDQSASDYGLNNAGGWTTPAAVTPHGMVQLGPDTTVETGGYRYWHPAIKAFSLTRFSGRGISCWLDVGIMPWSGDGGTLAVSPGDLWGSSYQQSFSHANETAQAGYYSVLLDTKNIQAELTAGDRAGVARFRYNDAASFYKVLIAAGHSANGNIAGGGVSLGSAGGTNITVEAPDLVTGSAQSFGCGGQGIGYTIYFAIKFRNPAVSWGTWQGSAVNPEGTALPNAVSNHNQPGAYLSFDTSVVEMKAGISFVSVANAKDNLNRGENPSPALPTASNPSVAWDPPFDFDGRRESANAAWHDYLSRINLAGANATSDSTSPPAYSSACPDDNLTTFYTGFYRALLHPGYFSDANGDFVGFDGGIKTFGLTPGIYGDTMYQGYAAWDQYRTLFPFLAVIDPQANKIFESLANMVRFDSPTSCLPRWQQAADDSRGMVGDQLSAAVASAYAYGGITNGAVLQPLLDAAVRGGLDPQARSKGKICREGLSDYLTKGYVANETAGMNGSMTLEYANADFAIAQMAKGMGALDIYYSFLHRSNQWQQMWNPYQRGPGPDSGTQYSGYLMGRNADGTFPGAVSVAAWTSPWAEGSAAQYLWMVPFGYAPLFDLMQAADPTIDGIAAARLLDHFGSTASELNAGPDSRHAFLGNEPSLLAPSALVFASRPGETASVLRRTLVEWYQNRVDTSPGSRGMPGNDDGGTMGSWASFAALGLNPAIPGVAGFALGSPRFSAATVNLANGRTLRINAPGASDTNRYVQDLALNGAPHPSPWISWDEIGAGAGTTTLDFTMGGAISAWGTNPAASAPSLAVADQGNDNTGTSPDLGTSLGSFDGLGNSFSRKSLAVHGFSSGAIAAAGGILFQWPSMNGQAFDNASGRGAVINVPPPFSHGAVLGILGSADGGYVDPAGVSIGACGDATVVFSDGTADTFNLAFSDWTLNGERASVRPDNTIAVVTDYRNDPGNVQNRSRRPRVYLFKYRLPPGKTAVRSLTLPTGATAPCTGNLHVFALGMDGLGRQSNNSGITRDQDLTYAADFDASGHSWSQDDLLFNSWAYGAETPSLCNRTFAWPYAAPGVLDNVLATGQTIYPAGGSGAQLSFLGASTGGPSQGTATLIFSDGSTQAFTLGFPDWTDATAGGSLAASHRNGAGGQEARDLYLFCQSIGLPAGRTLKSVQLPNGNDPGYSGALHLFAAQVN